MGERVCIRLTELSIRWSGVLRLGFSSHDPSTIQTLPKYACPDLTGKPGFWAKALAEKYAESNALIHYYFTANGDVHYGINVQLKIVHHLILPRGLNCTDAWIT